MKIRRWSMALMGALALGSLNMPSAQAANVIYSGTGFIQGTQTFTDSFSVATPGTVTVTLGNVAWPAPMASLNLLLTSASGALGPTMGAGTQSYNVAAGNVFAQWFGTAGGPLNTGVYSLEIDFQPSAGGNPVPLPTSIVLLLSGVGLLIWQRRTRSGALGDGAMTPFGDRDDLRVM